MPNVILTSVTRFAGPAILSRLVSKGHTVVACDAAFTDAALMSDYAARFGPLALLYASDQPKAIAQYARNALAEGRIDAVVCNDYFPAIRAPVSEAKLEDLRAGFDALVVAPFALVKELVPHLKTQASPSRIVVVSSASALRGLANYSMYCVARGAQNAMVLALAKEAPNYIKTPAYFPDSVTNDAAAMKKMLANVPQKRLGSADELAALCEFVAVGECGFVRLLSFQALTPPKMTGNVIPIAGGFGAL